MSDERKKQGEIDALWAHFAAMVAGGLQELGHGGQGLVRGMYEIMRQTSHRELLANYKDDSRESQERLINLATAKVTNMRRSKANGLV